MDYIRRDRIRSLLNLTGFGLEIGPSHSPIYPKADGFNVEILDYADAERLREIYTSLGHSVDRIEQVDYVSNGRPIHEAVPRRYEYDFIFSSHAIEHVPDLIGYFKSCEMLLKPGGKVALAVPDKRYTFDALRFPSTVGDALDAHLAGNTRHSTGTVIDAVVNAVLLTGNSSWSRADRGQLDHMNPDERVKLQLEKSTAVNPVYIDVHGWVFTPASFRLLLHDLRTLELTCLKEESFVENEALEFYVTLSREAEAPDKSRLDLQKALLAETVQTSTALLECFPEIHADKEALL
jgi:hypothetical protein